MSRSRLWVVVLAAAVAALVVAAPASANTKKQYTITFAPSPLPIGSSVDVTATVGDLNTSNQTIGSVQVVAPPGFTIVSSATPNASITPNTTTAGNTITYNDLSIAPGSSANLDLVVNDTGAACGTYNWTASARQANQFNSGGNVINPSPTTVPMTVGTICSLKFITEPHSVIDANPGTPSAVIGGADFTPPPPGVQVQLLDANGNPTGAGATVTIGFAPGGNPSLANLGGTTSVTADANGVATFDTLTVDQLGIGYGLQASAAGVSADSTPFDAVSNGVVCMSGVTCTIDAGNSFSNSSLTTNPTSSGNDGGSLFEVVNGFGGNQLVCPGYNTLDTNTFDFGMSSGVNSRTKTWEETIYDVAATQSAAANVKASVQVCFGDTTEFTNSKNKPAARGTLPDGSQGYIGLLPNCPVKSGPCIDRSLDSSQPDPSGSGFEIRVYAQIPAGYDLFAHN